jgi:hypothetical protein
MGIFLVGFASFRSVVTAAVTTIPMHPAGSIAMTTPNWLDHHYAKKSEKQLQWHFQCLRF